MNFNLLSLKQLSLLCSFLISLTFTLVYASESESTVKNDSSLITKLTQKTNLSFATQPLVKNQTPAKGPDDSFAYFTLTDQENEAKNLFDNFDHLSPEDEKQGITINFNNVSIIAYLKWISEKLGINFIFNDEELNFNITIISKAPVTEENIRFSLMQILQLHNLSILEQGHDLIIHTKEKGSNATSVLVSDESTLSQKASAKAAVITRVFQLHHTIPSRMKEIVAPLISTSALFNVSDETKQLIVTDLASNIEKVNTLLNSLDKPNKSLDIDIYNVKNSQILTLVSLATQILKPLSNENNLFLVPQKSSNTIYIISTPYLIQKAQSILVSLDLQKEDASFLSKNNIAKHSSINGKTPNNHTDLVSIHMEEDLPKGHIDSTHFKVYKVLYRSGQEIKESLQKIGTSLENSTVTNEELLSTITSVEWLASTNSLVYSGRWASIRKVEELIKSLDIPTKEVMIEMLILETSVQNSLQFGVQYALDRTRPGSPNSVASNFASSALSDMAAITDESLQQANTLLDSSVFSVGVIGKILRHGNNQYTSLSALIKGLAKDGITKVIMNPQITTENNSTGEFFVGTTDRFASTSIANVQGDFAETNYEYRQIGSRIRVTPSLGNSELVTLEIEQDINSSLTSDSTGTTNSALGPVTSTKTLRTKVHLPNKYFLILSGMIQENTLKQATRVPCLGYIPLLGAAFSMKNNAVSRTSTMIFIRPHIIDSAEEILKITKQQKTRIEEYSTPHNIDFDIDALLNVLNL